MSRRVITLLSTLGVALGGLAVTASPASAYSVTIGPLDTGTPGHVRGTVTSDAPWVVVRVADAYEHVLDTEEGSTGALDFDLETWGLETGVIHVQTCSGVGVGCVDAASTPAFDAADVVPAVTWPEATITGGDVTIAVTDSGGGYLIAKLGNRYGRATTVTGDGTPTAVPTATAVDGDQALTLWRCSNAAPVCRWLTSRDVMVDRPIAVDAFQLLYGVSPGVVVNTEETPRVGVGFQVHGTGVNPPAPSGLVYRATILDSLGNQATWPDALGRPSPAVGTWYQDLPMPDSWGDISVDISRLRSGSYTLRAEVSWGADPTQRAAVDYGLEVVNPAPEIRALSVSSTSVYPAPDGYRDDTLVTMKPATWNPQDRAWFEVRDSSGALVDTLDASLTTSGDAYDATWSARTESGAAVPAGAYTVTGHLADESGTASMKSVTVTVVRKHLVTRVWTKSVTPASSYVGRDVGSCSTVRQPALRGWSGSFGLYSNSKCDSSNHAAWVETRHALTIPKPANLHRYVDVRVSEYGGAATSSPGSKLGLAYLSRIGDWRAVTTLGAALGTHHGLTRPAPWFVHGSSTSRPWIRWRAYPSFRYFQYDVESFTVRLRYEVLVADTV